MTDLMNRLHREVGEELGEGEHIVDLYPGCTAGDTCEVKAESKYVEVAAASILARAVALDQITELEQRAGFRIPKGSTHVQEGLERLKEKGLDPSQFVKLHFRNVQKVFGNL